jgi:putative sterol carrier protein
MQDPSIEQIIEGMPSRFCPDAARGLDAVLQFRLSGDQAADFFATIANDQCALDRGVHENPTLTLKMSDQTYIDMVMGRLSGQEAFFKRKLRYEGPISLAVRLHRFFAPPTS